MDSRKTFRTDLLPLATFLVASQRLRFLKAEASSDGRVSFVFLDPDNLGDSVELEYESGASVSAIAYAAAQKFLRRRMDAVLNRGCER